MKSSHIAERVASFEIAKRLTTGHLYAFDRDEVKAMLIERGHERYETREAELTPEVMRSLEHMILLRNVDRKWMAHIDAMDALQSNIRLQAYAQRDPVREYKIVGKLS